MTEHERKADRLDDEVAEMEQRSEQLGEEISGVRKDWEAKQTDDAVPGAAGEPPQDSELPAPEPDETD